MAVATEGLMDRGLMKRLLTKSKEEPVACAVALAADGKSGLLLLDKIKQGKALERDLLKSEPQAKNPRFGTASVDVDEDAKLVKFTLNKPGPGLARRLVKTLKGTGFSKVIICGEDGSVYESSGEEEDEGQETVAEETAHPEPPAPSGEADKVRALIRALLPQVQGFAGDLALKTDMITKLQQANALLKAEAIEEAAHAVRAIAKMLAEAGAPKTGGDGQPTTPIQISPVRVGKAALLWRGMWAKAEKDMQALHASVISVMMNDEDVDPDDYQEIEGNLAEVGKVTEVLNLQLADDLDALRNATADQAAAPLAKLEKQLDAYESYLKTDKWITLLDGNEFHPVSVQTDMLKAVQVIRESLKPAA